ncbi:hypothetical protein ACFX2A_043480 [Malus domestica]
MYSCLVDRYGFSEDDIQVLIDTDDSYTQPTGKKKHSSGHHQPHPICRLRRRPLCPLLRPWDPSSRGDRR